MHAALRLLRVQNLAVSFVGAIVGGLVARGTGIGVPAEIWAFVILAGISTALVTAAGNVLNDILDLEVDRTNHPDRPLVKGEINVGTAQGLVVGLFVAGLFAALPVIAADPLVGFLLAVAVLSLLGYEFLLKARGFVGNLVVALLTALVFLYGGAAAGNATLLLPFAGMAFLATLSREVIKDMEDVRGDVGRTTLPMTYGIPYSGRVAQVSVLAAIGLSLVPLAWFVSVTSVVGIIYLVLVGTADGLFVLSVRFLPERLHYEQTMSKVAMTVALVAFLAVAFR
ncbi:MAG: geranylgeranylglycerol-phosphate geranylgeranyltransferase [Thermoplasmata archaeon]